MEHFYLAVVQDDPSSYSPTLEPLTGKIHNTYGEAVQELLVFFKNACGEKSFLVKGAERGIFGS